MEQYAPYFNDKWTLEDDFGLATIGDHLARVLLEAPPPFAARVSGKWGSGKTSVMRRAFAVLGGAPVATAVPLGAEKPEEVKGHADLAFDLRMKQSREFAGKTCPALNWPNELAAIANGSLCIWYSPWQHQNDTNPLLPLLLEVKAQFTARMKIGDKLGEINRKGGLAAGYLLEKAFDLGMTLTTGRNVNILSGTTEKVHKMWNDESNPLMKPGDGQRFQLVFEDSVKMVLEEVAKRNADLATSENKEHVPANLNKARLIIFVDDLDRCEESTAVKLLEFIKLYLNTPNCVFVFGMDNAALLQILARHWPDRKESANREYLEKLFQLTLAVPAPDPALVQESIFRQLRAHDLNVEESSKVAEHVVTLLEPNPRKLKNFTNSYCAQLCLTLPHMADRGKELQQLLVCLYLREFHGSIWRLIEREPWVFQLLHLVINREMLVDPPAIKNDPVRRMTLGLMRFLINKHFAHIFEEPDPNKPRVHNMTEDDAITHLLDHLDQRRSDTALRDMLNIKTLFSNEYMPQDYILRCLKPKDSP